VWRFALAATLVLQALAVINARASTYVVYIPLDSPIYDELEELNGLGYLDTYLDEIKPFSRVEAARLVLEAMANLSESGRYDPLAMSLINALDQQLHNEVTWLRNDQEDDQPTQVQPLDRIEGQYIYSGGPARYWKVNPNAQIFTQEQTPLLPYNDGLPTKLGSNEVMRAGGWAGFGGFLTGYSEGAVAGPVNEGIPGVSRAQLLGTEVVASFGNVAISFGQHERWWGTGEFGPLSQGDNAMPFWGVTIDNIHPKYLPGPLRYLGPGRREIFMGQGDGDKLPWTHPWIIGHNLVFKPLPWVELGMTRAIMFGGAHNDHYNFLGFLGRATGINTGSAQEGQTNSRGGGYLKFYLPWLRNTQVYQEILGEDNLTKEIPGIGRFMPFLAVSYQGGVYVPRLTRDGLTDFRFEYTILEPNYSVHADPLYWTYDGQLMGNALGPNATEVDLQVGRWFQYRHKVSLRLFYTEQAPGFGTHDFYPFQFYPYKMGKEHSVGAMLDLTNLPAPIKPFKRLHADILGNWHAKIAFEYASDLNYQAGAHSFRTMFFLSTSVMPNWNFRF
jgi:hypothetical protein